MDPIGIAGGLNVYGFAGGDPINFSDPFGLCFPWPSCALSAARAGAAVGTIAGAAVGGLFGGVGAAPGALIGNRVGWILVGGAATANAALLLLREGDSDEPREHKVPRPGAGGKSGATDVPSWAAGERPNVGESGGTYAERLLDQKYGEGKWKKGPGSEYNKIKKYGDRHFENPQ
jgi:hypothetical protein